MHNADHEAHNDSQLTNILIFNGMHALRWQASAPANRPPKTAPADKRASSGSPAPPAAAPPAWQLQASYGAYNAAPLHSIPPGYALVGPNMLVPLEALQARPHVSQAEDLNPGCLGWLVVAHTHLTPSMKH